MNKSLAFLGVLLMFTGAFASADPVTIDYGSFEVFDNPVFFTGPDEFDLTKCDVVVSFDLNLNGHFGNQQYSNLGLVSSSALGYIAWAKVFPVVVNQNEFDPEDRIVLGAPTRLDEDSYDAIGPDTVIGAPIGANPNDENFNFYFDRDSAGPGYTWPDNVDGVYDNTGGFYHIEITFHAISDTEATMFAKINGVSQGIYATLAADSEPEYFPVGKTIDPGDISKMKVNVNLSGVSVIVENVSVTGCLASEEVDVNVIQKKLNCKSKGVVPTIVYSSDTFDATDMDLPSVEMEGAPVVKIGKSWWAFYLAVPVDLNGDGKKDMLLMFDMEDLDHAGLEDGTADLSGELQGGGAFHGSDEIEMICKHNNQSNNKKKK